MKSWNKENYQRFRESLLSLQDVKYRDFHRSLVQNSKYEIIGIKTPIIKDIAKEIAKTDIEEFLSFCQDKYYEEVLIQGLVIARLKDEKKFYKYFNTHIDKIDNWALCDSFCSAIKIVEKYAEKYLKIAIDLAKKEDEFSARVGFVMLLNHFLNKDNLEIIFETLNTITSSKFYINMALSWLICEMYINFPMETEQFLKNNNLNKFTQNKAISKIHDSYRVSKEKKELLNNYRK